jgi:hypothetical protein
MTMSKFKLAFFVLLAVVIAASLVYGIMLGDPGAMRMEASSL